MEKKVNLIVFHTFVEQKPPNTLTESIEFITCKPASCHHLVCKSQNRFQDLGQLLYHVSLSGPWTALESCRSLLCVCLCVFACKSTSKTHPFVTSLAQTSFYSFEFEG